MERRRFLTGTVSVAALTGCLRLSGSDESGNGNGDSEQTGDQNDDSTPSGDGSSDSAGNGDSGSDDSDSADSNEETTDAGGEETTTPDDGDDTGSEETTADDGTDGPSDAAEDAIARVKEDLTSATNTLPSNIDSFLATGNNVNSIRVEAVNEDLDRADSAIQRARGENLGNRETEVDQLEEYLGWLRDFVGSIEAYNEGYTTFLTGLSQYRDEQYQSAISTLDEAEDTFQDISDEFSSRQSDWRSLPTADLRTHLGETVSTAATVLDKMVRTTNASVSLSQGLIDFSEGSSLFVNDAAPAYGNDNYRQAASLFSDATSSFASSIDSFENAAATVPEEGSATPEAFLCLAENFRDGSEYFENAANAALDGYSTRQSEQEQLAQEAIDAAQDCEV